MMGLSHLPDREEGRGGEAGAGLHLTCRELPAFSPNNLPEVRSAFREAAGCDFGQSWLPQPETDFERGVVHLGWRENLLLVFAELSDADIFTRVTGQNQRIWELGDAFEMFFRADSQAAYVEFQVAPNNQRLQLRFSDATVAQAPADRSFEKALLGGEAFRSRTWVEPESQRWFVYAEVPAASVGDTTASLATRQWHFSFGRYDYTRGREGPVISSTSPHAAADFHRQNEWGVLSFQP